MKQTLKQSVKGHYQSQKLEEEQLAQFEKLLSKPEHTVAVEDPDVISKHNEKRPAIRWISGIAASIALAITLLVYYTQHNNEQRIMAIATEVAKEHLHHNPLEVSSRDFGTVQQYFDKLDFIPSISSRLSQAQQLLGGRYCSIRNITAAQIRYANVGSPDTTLYQVGYDSNYFGDIPDVGKGESELIRHVKGITLALWVEKGLLMVAAHSGN